MKENLVLLKNLQKQLIYCLHVLILLQILFYDFHFINKNFFYLIFFFKNFKFSLLFFKKNN